MYILWYIKTLSNFTTTVEECNNILSNYVKHLLLLVYQIYTCNFFVCHYFWKKNMLKGT